MRRRCNSCDHDDQCPYDVELDEIMEEWDRWKHLIIKVHDAFTLHNLLLQLAAWLIVTALCLFYSLFQPGSLVMIGICGILISALNYYRTSLIRVLHERPTSWTLHHSDMYQAICQRYLNWIKAARRVNSAISNLRSNYPTLYLILSVVFFATVFYLGYVCDTVILFYVTSLLLIVIPALIHKVSVYIDQR